MTNMIITFETFEKQIDDIINEHDVNIREHMLKMLKQAVNYNPDLLHEFNDEINNVNNEMQKYMNDRNTKGSMPFWKKHLFDCTVNHNADIISVKTAVMLTEMLTRNRIPIPIIDNADTMIALSWMISDNHATVFVKCFNNDNITCFHVDDNGGDYKDCNLTEAYDFIIEYVKPDYVNILQSSSHDSMN